MKNIKENRPDEEEESELDVIDDPEEDCILTEQLGDKSKEELISITRSMIRKEHFSGPLPHPKIIKEYDAILPGAAERIFKLAESESDHRRNLEDKIVTSGIQDSKLGVVFAFIIGLVGIGGGIYVITLGYEWSGTILSGASLASIVGSFIYGTRNGKQSEDSDE